MSNALFPDSSNIDLREEMDALLFGRVDVTPVGRPVIMRHMTDNKCVCWDEVSGGPNRQCAYCKGEGWQWWQSQETFVIVRGVAPIYKPGYLASSQYPMASLGYTDPNKGTGYCRYSVFPNYERFTWQQAKSYDKVYELKVGTDGGLFYPITNTIKWKILNVVPLFGDYGRIEFYELTLEKENIG